jgi:hypothetical protein
VVHALLEVPLHCAGVIVAAAQPRKAVDSATWRGPLISTRAPKATTVSLNTAPAAAVHSIASAMKAPKQTQVDSIRARWRSSNPAIARNAFMGQQFPAW